jgi:hypothetical protein
MPFSAFKLQGLVLLLFLFSCAENKYAQESSRFSEYLQRTFNMKMPTEKTWYFIIPSSSCTGCQQSALSNLGALSGNAHVYILSSADNEAPEGFPGQRHLTDPGKGLNKLGLGFGGTGLVVTQEGKIIHTLPVTPHNLDSIISGIK